MTRKYFGTWEGPPHYRWTKMHKGERYSVKCRDLPIAREEWTKPASYQAAKEALEGKIEEATTVKDRESERLVDLAVRGQAAMEILRVRDNPPAFEQDQNTEAGSVHEALTAAVCKSKVEKASTVGAALDDFLAQLRATGSHGKTYREIMQMMDVIKDWYGSEPVAEIDAAKVKDAFGRIAKMEVEPNTKHKRWGFFKRWVRFLDSMEIIDLPRSLRNKDKAFVFKKEAKEIRTYPTALVQSVVKELPDKLRCWVLLGLNCGMTNTDIAELRHTQVSDGYLTRKRIKLRNRLNAPEVRYKLWPETLDLLMNFKSDDANRWFVSSTGTPLVSNRMDGDKPKLYDLIGNEWKWYKTKNAVPIQLRAFRNIGATLLEKHEVYGRPSIVEKFLADKPTTIATAHYGAASQELFDKATDWLRVQILG